MIADYSAEIEIAIYSNPFRKVNVPNEGRRSSNCMRVATRIVYFNSANSEIIGRKLTKFVRDCHLIFRKQLLNRICDIPIRFGTPACRMKVILRLNRLPWRSPVRNQKRVPDRSYANKYLSLGKKVVKIGPVDPEIIGH